MHPALAKVYSTRVQPVLTRLFPPRMHPALADLRRTRRKHRLGDAEWFDLAYKVYLAAIFGGGAVIVLSDQVGDEPATAAQIADVAAHGPGVLGLAAVLALALGLRSGADGGPLSIEPADVRHVLLSPIPHAVALVRPLVQRVRAAAFACAVVGVIGGLLAAQRLPGSPAAWMTSAGLAGAAVGVLFVSTATVTHALRVPTWAATTLAAAAIVAQVASIAAGRDGPAGVFGSLAMWGERQHAVDLLAVVAALAFLAAAVALVGRLRIEPLVRRADLVSQLRFAVTMQDLRTVVLVRRQLRNELPRVRPWPVPWMPADRRGAPTGAVVRRAVHGLARTPLARAVRMTACAAGAAVAAVGVHRGTTPLVVVVGVLAFLVGLDALEPLSQEVDHPERTDGYARDRGWLMLRLALPSAVAIVPVAAIGAAVVAVLEPGAAGAAAALAVPMAWTGLAAGVVSTVRDTRDPVANESVMMPPEFAGIGNSLHALLPLAVGTVAAVPVVVLREDPSPGGVVRSVIGLLLVDAAVALWVLRRDRWRQSWRSLLAGARP
jgi:hypothetical protein